MSSGSISRNSRRVNLVTDCQKYPDRFTASSPEEISILWLNHLVTESLAPIGLRAGIARARTGLLATIPQWELPAFLDKLAEEVA